MEDSVQVGRRVSGPQDARRPEHGVANHVHAQGHDEQRGGDFQVYDVPAYVVFQDIEVVHYALLFA